MSETVEHEIPAETAEKIDAMKNKSRLYRMMADDLRAQAGKLEYETKYPGKLRNTPVSPPGDRGER